MKNIFETIIVVLLLTGCSTEDIYSGWNDGQSTGANLEERYTTTSILADSKNVNAEAEAYVKGTLNSVGKSLKLDIKWAYLLEKSGDAIEKICFYKTLSTGKALMRTVAFKNTSTTGDATVEVKEPELSMSEMLAMVNGEWSVSLCTTKCPAGIVDGTLNTKKQEESDLQPTPIYATGFTLKDEESGNAFSSAMTLYMEDSPKTMAVWIRPGYADNKSDYTYASDNEDVLTVEDGSEAGRIKLTALKEGTANLTLTAKDQGESSASTTIEITVEKSPDFVQSIMFAETENLMVDKGQTLQLIATIAPETALNKTLTYTSSDEDVVTVDANGLVTGVGKGKATITVTATDREAPATASCEVTCNDPNEISEIKFADETVAIGIEEDGTGKTAQLEWIINGGESAKEKGVTFASSNESVATVDEKGVVTAVSEGTATITMTSNADQAKFATCSVRCGKFISLERTGWIAAASSQRHDNNQVPSKVLDGSNSTHWMNRALNNYLYIKFDSDKNISRVALDRRNDSEARRTDLKTADVYIIPVGSSFSFENDTDNVAAPQDLKKVGTINFGANTNTELTGTLDLDKESAAAGIVIRITGSNNQWRGGISEVRAYTVGVQ
ncbi:MULTISPECIES: Ig-like domain-containing protein [Bacteroides]|uniref:Ig-like domain-containing protein n=1 Tax=Bacteroides TaxID=816 RepID=UPI00319E35CA